MIRGVDTNVLVYLAAADVPQHVKVRRSIDDFLQASPANRLAVTADVLHEFVHVVTDPRRLKTPLRMDEAIAWAGGFWSSHEVNPLIPSVETLPRTLELLRSHRLSRKRIRDTALAAILVENQVRELLTANVADFRIFPFLDPIDPLLKKS